MTQEQKDNLKEFLMALVDDYFWVDSEGEIGYQLTDTQLEEILDMSKDTFCES